MRRRLWIVLACFLIVGAGAILVGIPDDPFARYLAFVGLAILGAGAAIDIFIYREESIEPRESEKRGYRIFGRSVLFAVFFFFSFFWIPFLGVVHDGLSALFFLWPQSTLFPAGLVTVSADDSARYFEGPAILGALVFWLLVASLYGVATEKRSLKFAALLAYPVMIALVVAVNYALHLAGFVAAYNDWP